MIPCFKWNCISTVFMWREKKRVMQYLIGNVRAGHALQLSLSCARTHIHTSLSLSPVRVNVAYYLYLFFISFVYSFWMDETIAAEIMKWNYCFALRLSVKCKSKTITWQQKKRKKNAAKNLKCKKKKIIKKKKPIWLPMNKRTYIVKAQGKTLIKWWF